MLDIHSEFTLARGLSPVVSSDNTELVSEIIDLQGYDGVEFMVAAGTLADAGGATFIPKIYAGDASNMSDEAQVTSADLLLGSATTWTEASDDAVQKMGYRGNQRYVRMKITVAGNSGSAPLCIMVLLRNKKIGTL